MGDIRHRIYLRSWVKQVHESLNLDRVKDIRKKQKTKILTGLKEMEEGSKVVGSYGQQLVVEFRKS